MGQRLNLEIHDDKNGGLLANAYYHWSGYSESAIGLTQQVVKALEESKQTNPLFRAIEALEKTGAALTNDEKRLNEVKLNGYEPQEEVGRNDGLMAISKEAMDDTRRWEEGRVEVHINGYRGNYVKYEVFHEYTPDGYKEDYEREATGLPLIAFDFEQIPFDKLAKLEKLVKQHDDIRIEKVIAFIK